MRISGPLFVVSKLFSLLIANYSEVPYAIGASHADMFTHTDIRRGRAE